MTLQDNGTTLPINTAGITGGPVPFSFGAVPSGSAYNVTVIVEPSPNSDGFDYLCAVANGVGTVTNANVGNIAVTCSLIGGYLYVTNGGGGNISGFAIDINSGALEPLTGVVAPIGQPNAVVTTTGGTPSASVSGCYQNALYIANSTTGKVSTYTVSSDTSVANPGALTLVGTPLGAGTTPEFLDFDYDDCAAFALNAGSSNVSSYSTVIATGALTAINTVGTGANSVPAASANTYVEGETTSFEVEYVASQVTNTLTAYSFSATGGLTLIPTDPAAGLPNPVATGVKPSAVAATTINVGVPGTTTDIETPFVYVANQTDDTITMYSGNATNYNAPIGLPKAFGTVNTGRGPTSLAVIGNLLYVANGLDNTVEAYSIDTSTTATTGTLTRLNLTFPTGTDPVFLQYAYVDYAPYLYVVNALSNDLYVYAVTTEGTEAQPLGTLTLVGKYAVGTAPTSVAAPYTYNPD
jgi:6-phosphogluconolactonase (cycloisomerase 2 family)